jgi:hypothetical protein
LSKRIRKAGVSYEKAFEKRAVHTARRRVFLKELFGMTKKIRSDYLLDNTVPAAGQLKGDGFVRFHYTDGAKLNVLFVGNSITLHGVKPEIGWYGDWGMAASKEENDYVHRLVDKLARNGTPVNFCIAQAAEWERAYWDGDGFKTYEGARAFAADIIIVRIGENTRLEMTERYDYAKGLDKFIKFFKSKATARVIITDLFWPSEVLNTATRLVAEGNGYALVHISDLGARVDMKAVGLFENGGVAAHPGDKGMEYIAERIFQRIKAD